MSDEEKPAEPPTDAEKFSTIRQVGRLGRTALKPLEPVPMNLIADLNSKKREFLQFLYGEVPELAVANQDPTFDLLVVAMNIGAGLAKAGSAMQEIVSESGLRVSGTGQEVDVIHKHHNKVPDPADGAHLWMIAAMFRVGEPNPPGGRFLMDQENLLTIEGPGCCICEEPYTEELAAQQCSGEPKERS